MTFVPKRNLEPPQPNAELRKVKEGLMRPSSADTHTSSSVSFSEELPPPKKLVPYTNDVRLKDHQEPLPMPSKPVAQTSFQTKPQPLLPPVEKPEAESAALPAHQETAFNEPDPVLDKPLQKKTARNSNSNLEAENGQPENPQASLSRPRPMTFSPLVSAAGGLLIVLSAFFLLALLFRKIAPKGTLLLPKEAFENLGRTFISAKQQLQLLRLGNRLILVSVTPSGLSTVSEITDPDEVVSLLGMCKRYDEHSSTQLFRKTVEQMSDEEINQHYKQRSTYRKPDKRRSGGLDLYSDPDESLAEILAKQR